MFDKVLEDIELVFGGDAFKTENIKVYPENYNGDISNETEFCRMSVLPSNGSNYAFGAKKILSGMLMIRIFVSAGYGQKRAMEIADIFDNYFENRLLTGGTKLDTSYLNVVGLDSANPTLYSVTYIIPFMKYGE